MGAGQRDGASAAAKVLYFHHKRQYLADRAVFHPANWAGNLRLLDEPTSVFGRSHTMLKLLSWRLAKATP
jgi:hypothetical protein